MIEAGHLGGYVAGGDAATYYPDLWLWLVKERGVESVLDVGCGDGVAVDYFNSLGCDAIGVEGVPQDHDLILEHDYTTGPLYFDQKDLVWSCEFVEHVEERYAGNFLASFASGKLLLMTHAEPGQAGYHHVNCQDSGYWIVRVENETGLVYDPDLTALTRKLAAENRDPFNHFARSGLAFQRREQGMTEHESMRQGEGHGSQETREGEQPSPGTERTEKTEISRETTETVPSEDATPSEPEEGAGEQA